MLRRNYPILLVIFGTIGLIASLILTHDTLAVSHNPGYVPSCNLNPVLSCGEVIKQSGTVFGLAYPFYGIGVFAVLVAMGAGMLAGAKYRRWYWVIFQILMTLGTVGAYALLAESIFQIHALCPFCLAVDVAITVLFWYTTLYVIDNKFVRLNGTQLRTGYAWIRNHHLDLLVLWFLVVIGFILKHFWYYYGRVF